MKRSEINRALRGAQAMLDAIHFALPPFAYFEPAQWREREAETAVIRATMLGWDITDFGQGHFDEAGAVLFTLRNGLPGRRDIGTPFAEKLICIKAGQHLPLHYHRVKSEDIITRGGRMWMELYNAHKAGSPGPADVDRETPVKVFCDGIEKTYRAGERFEVPPGSSVSLVPYLYHRFGADVDSVVGEVSSINDDRTDNYWAETVSRFSTIEEDEPPMRLLCNEYG